MGIVYSHVRNKLMRFNVENRALRAIEKDKPVPAPQHPSTKKLYNKIIDDTPAMKAQIASKDTSLDKLLRDIYVTSQDMTPGVKRDVSKLPKERRPQPDDDFGFKLPLRDEIPQGYVNLKDAIQFITDHRGEPKLWTIENIANEYKLDKKDVGDVLEYFRVYNLHVGKLADDKGGMYSVKRLREDSLKSLLPEEGEEWRDPQEKKNKS